MTSLPSPSHFGLPIRLRFADGYQLQASASLVGANDLLTATHVVYQPQHGGWASELAIVDEHGQATPVSGWQVWANPRQVYADTDPTTLTLGESQYDLALIGLNRQLPGSPLSLASDSRAPSGSAFGYPQGQTLTDLHTALQHGQDGYSVYQSSNTELGPGSSGGPLLNEAGQLIGINSAGTPGSATWWADIGPFLPQLTEQMQANDSLLQDTVLNHTGPRQTSTGASLPALLPTGRETVGVQWPNAQALGTETRVNSTTTGDQTLPAVAALSGGGYVVAWKSYIVGETSGFSVNTQRYSSSGTPLGSEQRVDTTLTTTQHAPAITALADGGYIVCWSSVNERDGDNIYAQRYDGNGSKVGKEFRVNADTTAGNQTEPTISALADGGFIIAWTDRGPANANMGFDDGLDGSGAGIFAQRYASNGSTVGGEFRINSYISGDQWQPAITGLADGGYVAVWQDGELDGTQYYGREASGLGLYAQRFASNGNRVGSEFQVNTTTASDQQRASIQALTDGGFVIAWDDAPHIRLQRYTNTGSQSGSETVVNPAGNWSAQGYSTSIAPMKDGGFVIGWDYYTGSPNSYDLYTSRYDAGGSVISSEQRINTFTSGDQAYPSVASLSNGNYVIAWASGVTKVATSSSQQDGSGAGIYAQRLAGTEGATSIQAKTSSQAEGSGGTTAVQFDISRTASQLPGSVDWSISSKSTTDANDLSSTTQGTVSFASGETSKQITLYVNADTTFEADEALVIQLANPVNLTLGTDNASTTITNDDSLLTISATAASVDEGSGGGSNPLQYTVSRNNGSASASVNWAFQPGSATADDLTGTTSGTLSFAAGETSKQITLNINKDNTPENDESFTVALSNPAGAAIVTGSATQTIKNDDAWGNLSIATSIQAKTSSQAEGSGGTTAVQFDISRTASQLPGSVDWSISSKSTTDANDLSSTTQGTVSFASGETSKQITLYVNADTTFEADEALVIQLANPVNLTLGTDNASTTITNDDSLLTISATAASVDEGSGGGSNPLQYTVSRNNGSASASVNWAFQPGSATADDLTGTTSGTLSFAAGETSKQITLNINKDNTPENDESFTVALSNPAGAAIVTGSATQTIKNDDAWGNLSIATSIQAKTSSQAEGSGGTTAVQFDISRTASQLPGSVDWSISSKSTTDANDLSSTTQGTVSFASGETSKQITLYVNADTTFEADEALVIQLANPVNLTLGTDNASTTITNDDSLLTISATAASVDEGSGGGSNPLQYTVSRNNGSASASVNWAFQPGSATADDLTGTTSGTLSFAAGETSKQITLNINKDNTPENDESFTVALSNPAGAAIVTGSATQTIKNDDAWGNLSIATSIQAKTSSQAEGSGGTTAVQFDISRTASQLPGSVDWSISSKSTTDANDLSSTTQGTVSFASGETSKQITLYVNADTTFEADEALVIQLANPVNLTLGTDNASTTITNDDSLLTISATAASVDEGSGGGSNPLQYTVSRNNGSASASVNWAFQPGSATADDLTGTTSGTLSFAAGETSKQITLNINKDNTPENDESFTVALSNPAGAAIVTGSATQTIKNDDAWGNLSIATSIQAKTSSQAEGSGGTTAVQFDISRTASQLPGSVDWSISSKSTTDANDLSSTTQGTVSFASGETSKQITLYVNADTTFEADEALVIQLANPVNLTLGTDNASTTITNDDSLLTISATAASVDEGSGGGSNPLQYTVSRNNGSASASVNWAFQPGSATADDLTGTTSGTLSFAAGETSKQITLNINKDNTPENDESFTVALSNPAGAAIVTGSATQTIKNDDAWGNLSIATSIQAKTSSQAEGSGGTTAVQFDISRTASQLPGSVDWSISSKSTTDANDLSSTTQGTVSFASGETSKQITLYVNADTTFEADEALVIQLANPVNLTLGTDNASTTITNDDSLLTISATAASVDEGSGGGSNPLQYTVSRNNGSASASVNWAFQPGSATADDLTGTTSGTLSFAAGETSKQITLNINKDNTPENDESFTVALSNPAGAAIVTGSATQTIKNDDAWGNLSIATSIQAKTSSQAEGSGGTTAVQFDISRTASQLPGSVDWSISSKSTTDANDLSSTTQGTVSFASGETSKQITLYVNADTTFEADEALVIQLANPVNLTLGTDNASTTITNDDSLLTISATAASVDEGSGGGSNPLQYTVSRNNGSASASVNWAFQPGSATADDLTGTTSGTLSFAAGETSKQITLNINKDNTPENDESFTVALSNPAGAAIVTGSATQTIKNDDAWGNLSIATSTPTVTEGSSGGSTPVQLTITRSGSTTGTASVNWAFKAGTASSSDLNGSTSGSVSFAAGETSKQISLNINADTTVEPDETFSIVLSNPTNATLTTSSVDVTIANDDVPPTLAEAVLYRCVKYSGAYFYTSNTAEIQYIQDAYLDVIRFEGFAFNCLNTTGKPVYRFALLDGSGSYFYTTDEAERSARQQQPGLYRDEGIQFRAAQDDDTSAMPVYRLKHSATGNYLLTANAGERDIAISQYGYQYERVAFHVPKAGTPNGLALAAGQDAQFTKEGSFINGSLKYNVLRIGDTTSTASVQWNVAGNGANPANASDFTSGLTSGQLNFAAGEAVKTITLSFYGDTTAEPDETFNLTLSNPKDTAILVGSMAGKIINDEGSSTKGFDASPDTLHPLAFWPTLLGQADASGQYDG